MPTAISSGMTKRSESRTALTYPFAATSSVIRWHSAGQFRILDRALPTWETNARRLSQHGDARGAGGAGSLDRIGTASADSQRILDRVRIRVRQLLVHGLWQHGLSQRLLEDGWNGWPTSAAGWRNERMVEERERRNHRRRQCLIYRLLLPSAGEWSLAARRRGLFDDSGQQWGTQRQQHGRGCNSGRRV